MNIKAARIHDLLVAVCGVGELPDFAGEGITHIVSLWDGVAVDHPEPRRRIESIFPVAKAQFGFFDDVVDDFFSSYPPTIEAVRVILDFTGGLHADDYLLLHCTAGISRSTALAFATLCQHAGPGHELDCLTALREIRPCAYPNPLIVRFADTILGRDGLMIEAIQARWEVDGD